MFSLSKGVRARLEAKWAFKKKICVIIITNTVCIWLLKLVSFVDKLHKQMVFDLVF